VTCESEPVSGSGSYSGTWQLFGTEVTDWVCPITNIDAGFGSIADCPTSVETPHYSGTEISYWSQDGTDPAGTACTEDTYCKMNYSQSCNIWSDLYVCDGTWDGGEEGGTVETESASVTITVTSSNNAPNAPTITGDTTGETDTSYTFNFQATDPDADTIRYQIDWDNNGSVDETVPSSGYVASGSTESASRTWTSSGSKTFKARTGDDNGATSSWATHTIVISAPTAPPTAILTADPTSINQGDSTTLTWSATDANSCTGTGFSTGGSVSGEVDVAPSSSTTYTLSCSGDGGGDTDTAEVTVILPQVTVTLNSSATTVDPSDTVVLDWSSTNATSCTALQGGGFSTGGITGGNDTTDPLSVHTTFIVECTGAGGSSAQDQVTVNVRPEITLLTTTPSTVASGDSTTIDWSANNSTSCTGTNFSTGGLTAGSVEVANITASQTYILDCSGPGGSTQSQVTVTLAGAPIANLSAVPATVISGNTTLLSWTSTDADSCSGTGNGFVTGGATEGSDESGVITGDETFTLTCTGPGGPAQDTEIVTLVPPPTIDSFYASPSSVAEGGNSVLIWATTDATSCTATSGDGFSTSGAASGSDPVSNITDDTTYTISCSGDGGSAVDSTQITILPPGIPTVDSFTASPSTITEGESLTLAWSSIGANSCTGTNFSTGGAVSGSVTVSPTASLTYSIVCTGDGGSSPSSSVPVTVNESAGGSAAVYLEGEYPTSSTGAYGTTLASISGYSCDGYIESEDHHANTTTASSDDTASYTFTVTDGSYEIWFRINNNNNGGDDSWFYRVDDGSWTLENGTTNGSSDWFWYEGSDGPYSLNGEHTLEIANREDGWAVDKIYITQNGDTPTDTGGIAYNCPGNGLVTIDTVPPGRTLIRPDEEIGIRWTAQGVSSCAVDGPQLAVPAYTDIVTAIDSTQGNISLEEKSTFSISCDGGAVTAELEVDVLPSTQEK